MSSSNPFFNESHLRDGAVPFSKININDYLSSLDTAIFNAKANIQKICDLLEKPSFKNTIEQ